MNVTSQYDKVGRLTDLFGTITQFSYDETYQLTGVETSYLLDWTDLTTGDWSGLTSAQWSGLGSTANATSSASYDANGNPEVVVTPEEGTVTCTYDDANRLSTRTTAAGIAIQVYFHRKPKRRFRRRMVLLKGIPVQNEAMTWSRNPILNMTT